MEMWRWRTSIGFYPSFPLFSSRALVLFFSFSTSPGKKRWRQTGRGQVLGNA
jgi:hypothetical protein